MFSLLLIPLLLGYGYAFPRAIKGAGRKIILLSALIARVYFRPLSP